jgi:hypothetical protein
MGLITEAHYSRDNTRLYESNYKVTVDGGKGEFIVGGVWRVGGRRRDKFLGSLRGPVWAQNRLLPLLATRLRN